MGKEELADDSTLRKSASEQLQQLEEECAAREAQRQAARERREELNIERGKIKAANRHARAQEAANRINALRAIG